MHLKLNVIKHIFKHIDYYNVVSDDKDVLYNAIWLFFLKWLNAKLNV